MNEGTNADVRRECVAVLGLGYVGCVTAACLAHLGHRVIGVDRDAHKLASLREKRAPFYEPGLEPIIREAVESGRLSGADSVAEALAEADIVLVCVGTPSGRNGDLNLEQLRRVCAEVRSALPGRTRPLVLAIRSTVFPGTCEEVVWPALEGAAGISVVSNPEFLREGEAVKDFLEPSLLVVGGDERPSVERVARLYAGLPVTPCLVSLRTAEMIKYACNAFHAVKIAFANEIATLCSSVAVSGEEVMETVCRDVRLNISPAYLRPGFAFGGSCLPKDLRAMMHRATRRDLSLPMLGAVLSSNREHLARAVDRVLEFPAGRIGIFGLTFKEQTDDLRESPAVALIEELIGKGRDVRIFDPYIRLDRIYGSNRNFVLAAVPHISRLLARDLDELLEWAECLVVTQRPAGTAAERIARTDRPVVNLLEIVAPEAALTTAQV